MIRSISFLVVCRVSHV